jgi:Zn-finger protein
MENSYRFFNNHECQYYPCHTVVDIENFNCMFCFCPLYFLGDKCGGNFKYSGSKRVKSCVDCHLPHMPEYYDTVVEKLKKVQQKDE